MLRKVGKKEGEKKQKEKKGKKEDNWGMNELDFVTGLIFRLNLQHFAFFLLFLKLRTLDLKHIFVNINFEIKSQFCFRASVPIAIRDSLSLSRSRRRKTPKIARKSRKVNAFFLHCLFLPFLILSFLYLFHYFVWLSRKNVLRAETEEEEEYGWENRNMLKNSTNWMPSFVFSYCAVFCAFLFFFLSFLFSSLSFTSFFVCFEY